MRDALIGTREHAPTATAKGDTSFHVAIPAGHGHGGMLGIIEHPPKKTLTRVNRRDTSDIRRHRCIQFSQPVPRRHC